MYGIAIEYDTTLGGPADPSARAVSQAHLAGRTGYRRRLALQADAWRRVVDLFLFADADAARAALASDAWRAVAVAHPSCRAAAPALLVTECPWGGPVVLLRSAPGPTRGGQSCWRDHLAHVAPEAVLW